METTSSSSDARKAYAVGIGICAAVLIVFAAIAAIEPTYAQGDFGLGEAAGTLKTTGGGSLPAIIGRIISAALGLVGVVFLFLMLIGGIRWMTARGNATYAETAKDTIIRAVIGLIIVASAYAITSFVINRVTTSTDGSSGASSGSTSSSASCVALAVCTGNADCNGGTCGPPAAIDGIRRCSCVGA